MQDANETEIQLLPDGSRARVALRVEAKPIYFLAMAHRPLIQKVDVDNLALPDPDETDTQLIVSCRLDSAAGSGFVTPAARQFPVPAKGVPAVVRSLSPTPSREALALLEERIQGTLIVEATWDDELVGRTAVDVEFLAHNQWMFAEAYFDTLAAFVMPNTSMLDGVLDRARAMLLRDTGSSSTEGYQSGPDRADKIASAIYQSLQAEQLAYSDPPASFEGYGQKIRTPEDVMEERTATCLDSAALYASCLLRVGLTAYITIVKGHAFTMYATHDPEDWSDVLRAHGNPADLVRACNAASSTVTKDPSAIATLRNAGLLRAVETTCFTRVPHQSFEEALEARSFYFSTKQNEIWALVDVGGAVASGITPLPHRYGISRDDVAPTIVVGPEEAFASASTPVIQPSDVEVGPSAPSAPARVEAWKRSLLNLDFNNPLLRIKNGTSFVLRMPNGVAAAVENRLMANGDIEVRPATRAPSALRQSDDIAHHASAVERDGAVFYPPATAVDQEIESSMRRPEYSNLPPALARTKAEEDLDRRLTHIITKQLRSLKRKADDIERQSGTNNLFLCVGLLEWSNGKGTSGSAPLFLVPVRLTGSAKDGYRIAVDSTNDPMPNQCLVEKLRADHGVDIPTLSSPPLDDAGIDVSKLIAGVRAALIDRPFGNAVVHDDVALAVLDFASFRLWKDLRDHWQDFMTSRVFAHLVDRPGETFEDPNAEAELPEVLMPELHDASQTIAVQWAAAGRSFVLQGPPGTGKSQTITNLLAAAMARGMKVLFVAEKATALDVVRRRLAGVGLNSLCLELFDKNAKSEHIAGQIRESIDLAPPDVDGQWSEIRAKVEATRRRLDDYRDGIHKLGPAGLSLWGARQELARLGDGPEFPMPSEFLIHAAEDSDRVLTELLDLPRRIAGGRVQPGAWALAGAVDFEQMDRAAVHSAVVDLTSARSVLDQLDADLRAAIDQLTDPGSMIDQAHAIGVATSGGLTAAEVQQVLTTEWSETARRLVEQMRAFHAHLQLLPAIALDTALTTDLNALIAQANEAAVAGALRRNRALRELHVATLSVLRDQGERPATEVLQTLQWIQQLQSEWSEIIAQASALPALDLPSGFDARSAEWLQWVETRTASLPTEARAATGVIPQLTLQLAAQGRADSNTVIWVLQTAGSAWNTLITQLGVTSSSATRWLANRTFADAWRTSLGDWNQDGDRLLGLQRWCDTASALSGLEAMGLGDIASAVLNGDVALDDAAEMFQRGLARAALAERVDNARFDVFDPTIHDRAVAEYRTNHGARRDLMTNRIPAELVAGRPVGQGQRAGVWGKIDRHLAAKRRRISIRGLMEEFGQYVTDLTPCFLMSPDSVARFLPPGKVVFDLVVFDEASQIEVPRAVGALGRARAAVVVGDSKQMPPSRFGGAATNPDDIENGAELDIIDLESLLDECRESNLPALTLACHYRSRHEALIAFSNQHFYEDRLLTFPNPDGTEQAPIGWRRVDGRFRRKSDRIPADSPYSGGDWPVGTNRIEAEAVVAEIEQRVVDWHTDPANRQSTDPGPSIGVVTSNKEQRELIRDLLAASGDERVVALAERDDSMGLLVQNLQDVQGDERDVFIMSIGFAPRFTFDEHGHEVRGRLPMHFGPLNNQGGERRLNVAVTRARTEMVVFCSFDPEEMNLSSTSARGMHLLNAYLSAARSGAGRSPEMVGRVPTAPDRHRREIAEALRAAGLDVSEDVGLSAFRIDLAVRRPGSDRWQVAILLDGPRWAGQPTPYDRDVLPSSVLHMMGWPQVQRIWLPAWLSFRDEVLAGLNAALDAAEEATRPAPVPPPLPPDLRPIADTGWAAPASSGPAAPSSIAAETFATSHSDMEHDELGDAPSALQREFGDDAPPFRVPDDLTEIVAEPSLLDRIGEPDADSRIRTMIAQTADLLGPILLEDLCRRTARRCGLGQVRQNRIGAIASLVDPSMCSDADGESVVWPARVDPSSWLGFRRNDEQSERGLVDTPLVEISNVMGSYVAAGLLVDREELMRVAGRFLGAQRLGAALKNRLNRAVDLAEQRGLIASVGDDSFSPPN
ncbi:MAG: DUF4011 domain-containing protein [Microthrixaceae bacterium]